MEDAALGDAALGELIEMYVGLTGKRPARGSSHGAVVDAIRAARAAQSAPRTGGFMGVEWTKGRRSAADPAGPKDRMKAAAAARGHVALLQVERPGGEGGFHNEYGSFPTWEEAVAALEAVPPEERHVYELMARGTPVKPYMDVDCKELPLGYADVEAVAARVRALTVAVFRCEYGAALRAEDVVITRSPNQDKACSLHLVVSTHGPQLVFRDNEAAKHLAERVAAAFPDGGIDLGVYTKDRVMRLCGSTKFTKPQSALEVLPGEGQQGGARFERGAVPRDAVITWLDAAEELRVIEPPAGAAAVAAKKSVARAPKAAPTGGGGGGSALAPVEPEVVRALLALLKDGTAADRGEWRAVGLALKHEGGRRGDPDAYLAEWLAFSARGGASYKGAEDAAGEWEGLVPDGRLGAGSLFHLAKRDDPEGYRDARRGGEVGREVGGEVGLPAGTAAALVRHLRAVAPPSLADLTEEGVEFSKNAGRMDFRQGGELRGWIQTDKVLLVYSEPGGALLGPLVPGAPLYPGPLTAYHASLRGDTRFAVHPRSREESELRSTDPQDPTRIEFIHEPKDSMCGRIVRPGRDDKLVLRTKLKQMDAQIAEVQRAHAVASLGAEAFGALLQFNNCTFNIAAPPDSGCRDVRTLAELVMRTDRDLFERRIKHVPDLKSNNCNGLYLCDPETNIWKQRGNLVLENVLLRQFDALPEGALSEAEVRKVHGRTGCIEMLHAVSRECIDESFDQRLDVNRDLFALDNAVVDVRTKTRRPLQPEDLVRTTAGWSYDADLAAAKRADVERFFEQIMPLPDERRVVLAFLASSLSGNRGSKRFLALTDRRSGWNGKSTLVALLQTFFGNYAESSTKFVCEGSFQQDRNSHDAGMEPFRATRLLVAEELKHNMRLDSGLLKKVVGGNNVMVNGRKFGSGERFKFIWQANLLLVFNEGDCPQTDGDAALMSRMIVAPMRSKFAFCTEGLEDEEHVFPADKDIHDRFPSWRSALLDILVENYDPAALDAPPPSMLQWHQGVASGSNPLASWMESHVRRTGDKLDYLLFPDLLRRFQEDAVANRRFAGDEFKRLAKNYLISVAVRAKEKDNVKLSDGTWTTKYGGVYKGVCLQPLDVAPRGAGDQEEGEEGT